MINNLKFILLKMKGLIENLISPSLNDLKFMFRTTMTKINYMNSFGSVGYLCGTLGEFNDNQTCFNSLIIVLPSWIPIQIHQ